LGEQVDASDSWSWSRSSGHEAKALMGPKLAEHRSLIGPLELRERIGFEVRAARGWAGMETAYIRESPPYDVELPPNTHHFLALIVRPADEAYNLFDGLERHTPFPPRSILLVPAGTPARMRASGSKELLDISLDPALVARVAVEAFDLDPARVTIPPLNGVILPHLRAAMLAVGVELTAGGPGGSLAAESLANVLAVQLIRHSLAPRPPKLRNYGALSLARLRAVVEYIEEHLGSGITLEQVAAVAHLSVFHFARQFKETVGTPPHQYVIARRVKRAEQLMRPEADFSLAQIAALVGFSDQSQFSHHFKRIIGVPPGQFRRTARIA
jgi:AraC family transcriptional regulator